MAKTRKLTKSKLKEMKFGPVPVEIAIEDLMLDLAKKGVTRFTYEERRKYQFILKWHKKDKEQCINLSVQTMKEARSIRKTMRDYTRTMNKRIKDGEFDIKAPKGAIEAEVIKKS